jgi:hypothetical protein
MAYFSTPNVGVECSSQTATKQHGVTSKKIVFFTVTAITTSNLSIFGNWIEPTEFNKKTQDVKFL